MNSKLIIASIILIFFGVLKPAPYDGFLLMHTAGQSNLLGAASGAPSDPELLLQIDSGFYYTADSNIVNLDYNNTGGHGVEYYVAYNLGGRSYWTKTATAETSLELHWYPGSNNFNLSLQKLLALDDSLTGWNYTYTPDFYWNNWEMDAMDSSRASHYYANFIELVDSFEFYLGRQFDKIIAVRPLTTAKTIELGVTRSYADITRAQYDSIDLYAPFSDRFYLIPIDDISTVDGSHYTSGFMDTVAARVLNIILEQ